MGWRGIREAGRRGRWRRRRRKRGGGDEERNGPGDGAAVPGEETKRPRGRGSTSPGTRNENVGRRRRERRRDGASSASSTSSEASEASEASPPRRSRRRLERRGSVTPRPAPPEPRPSPRVGRGRGAANDDTELPWAGVGVFAVVAAGVALASLLVFRGAARAGRRAPAPPGTPSEATPPRAPARREERAEFRG